MDIAQMLQDAVVYAVAAVGAASAVVKALEIVADVTPTDADDKWASTARRYVGRVAKLLDKLALNPKR